MSRAIELTWPAGGTGVVPTQVACPAGKRVIGGGAGRDAEGININESRPIDLPGVQRWSGAATMPVINTTGQTLTLTVTAYAICATTAP